MLGMLPRYSERVSVAVVDHWSRIVDFLLKPRASEHPVPLDGLGRDTQRDRGLLERQTREESMLDDLGRSRIRLRQAFERVVQSEELLIAVMAEQRSRMLERESRLAGASLLSSPGAGVVDQDPTHGLGSDREEVVAIPGADLASAREAHIGLVHECSRAEGVIGPLVTELRSGEGAQFLIYHGKQSVERVGVALSKTAQPFGHPVSGRSQSRRAHKRSLVRRFKRIHDLIALLLSRSGHQRPFPRKQRPRWSQASLDPQGPAGAADCPRAEESADGSARVD